MWQSRVWQSVDECGRGQEQGKQGNDGQASRQGKGQRREIKGAATKTLHFLFGSALSLLTDKGLDFFAKFKNLANAYHLTASLPKHL